MCYMGVDLSSSPKRPSTVAVIDGDGVLLSLSQFNTYRELLGLLGSHPLDLIGIDAPLGLPLGLHCLDRHCPCSPTNGHKGRMAEVELAKMGIGCFYTGKNSIVRKLIYRAVKLGNSLRRRNYDTVEIYPYATKFLIFGADLPSKKRPESLTYLREYLPKLVPGLEPYIASLDHDVADAILTAYTGYLHNLGRTRQLGIAEEGLITIPIPSEES
mgnify:CR=1 FL=1